MASVLALFQYEDLPLSTERDIRYHFYRMAHAMSEVIPEGPNRELALTRLLDAQAACVMAAAVAPR